MKGKALAMGEARVAMASGTRYRTKLVAVEIMSGISCVRAPVAAPRGACGGGRDERVGVDGPSKYSVVSMSAMRTWHGQRGLRRACTGRARRQREAA